MYILLLLGTNSLALSGKVQYRNGDAIEGATVSLLSDTSIHVTTSATGEFTIDKTVSVTYGKTPAATSQSRISITLKSNRIQLQNPLSSRTGSIMLLTGNGRTSIKLHSGPLSSGTHQLPLPELAPGLYILRIDLDAFSGTEYMVNIDKGEAALLPRTASGRSASMQHRTAASGEEEDTLLVTKEGFVPVEKPITSYDQSGMKVVMFPMLPPTTRYDTNGPFTPVVESNVGPDRAYAIVRPDNLGKDAFLHSPIIYGYGINGNINGAMNFLKPLASHGFVIIACNKLTGGPNSPANNSAMTRGLDWLLEQNSTPGSKFNGMLAVDRAVSMGYSVGGTAAVDIGEHEAIMTVVSIHGHKSDATLHGTLLQTTGTKDNIGLPMQEYTFSKSKVPTFLGTVTNADHGYPGTDGREERPAIIAWLRYWLYNDTGARHYFYGDDCVLCKSPWENPQRKNWE